MSSQKYFVLIFLFIFFLLFVPILAEQNDSTITKHYVDYNSFWGLKVGRFHFGGRYFQEDGVTGVFLNENRMSGYLYFGCGLQLYKTIGTKEGAISLNAYLCYPLNIGEQKFLMKAGAGLVTVSSISPVITSELEYILFDFQETALTVSVQQSLPGLPFVVNIGFLF